MRNAPGTGIIGQMDKLTCPGGRTLTQRQFDATDREIDRLVYELYELKGAEIAIVQGRAG